MGGRSSKPTARESIVLLSGGLDSAACVAFLRTSKRPVRGLFIDYGQAAARPELAAARRVAKFFDVPFRSISLTGVPKRGTGELVARNAFLVLSAAFAGGITRGQIVIGIHSGTPYFDCSPAFVKSIAALVEENTSGSLTVSAPFVDFTKPEIFEFLARRKFPVEITYSCEAGARTPCGKCLSCRDREALHAL